MNLAFSRSAVRLCSAAAPQRSFSAVPRQFASSSPAELHDKLGTVSVRHRKKITIVPLVRFAHLMNQDAAPLIEHSAHSRLPFGAHWLYFQPLDLGETFKRSEAGPDGLFPMLANRTIWAGGSITYENDILAEDEVIRVTKLTSVSEKSGKSGPLVIARFSEQYSNDGGKVAISESRDMIYPLDPKFKAVEKVTKAPPDSEFEHLETITPDPTLLFRYSALTYNCHRIHYDLRYCQEQEGYPDLVVHGPLSLTLLVDMLQRRVSKEKLRHVEYRNAFPLFCNRPMTLGILKGLHGPCTTHPIQMMVFDDQRNIGLQAKATYA